MPSNAVMAPASRGGWAGTRNRSRRKKSLVSSVAFAVFAVGCLITLSLDIFWVLHIDGHEVDLRWIPFFHVRNFHRPWRASSIDRTEVSLSCRAYGGPHELAATQEMVYWRNVPSDNSYTSPFFNESDTKFLLFDPDVAGFNNKRIAFETFLILAHATGRTLVLPPRTWWYACATSKNDTRRNSPRNGFEDVFDVQAISREHRGVKIISTDEFLERYALQGKLRHHGTGEAAFPPRNQTNWNHEFPRELRLWLANATHTMKWRYEDCVMVFPANNTPQASASVAAQFQSLTSQGAWNWKNVSSPLSVDAPISDRMVHAIPAPTALCPYTEEMHHSDVIYFHFVVDFSKPNYRDDMVRLLAYFYAFVLFEDWQQDLRMKRLIRDHVRYRDEFQCAAARIVAAVRKRARHHTNTGVFDSMHIRRSPDFEGQFGGLMSAQRIYHNSKGFLQEGSLIYIATDEPNRTFFAPLAEHFELVFLSDFEDMISVFHPYLYGMIDQLVAAKGRTFVGTWSSTFTGYINRLRGYYATKLKLEGYHDGKLRSYYYNSPKKDEGTTYHTPVKAWFTREFPLAWRDIDRGAELPVASS